MSMMNFEYAMKTALETFEKSNFRLMANALHYVQFKRIVLSAVPSYTKLPLFSVHKQTGQTSLSVPIAPDMKTDTIAYRVASAIKHAAQHQAAPELFTWDMLKQDVADSQNGVSYMEPAYALPSLSDIISLRLLTAIDAHVFADTAAKETTYHVIDQLDVDEAVRGQLAMLHSTITSEILQMDTLFHDIEDAANRHGRRPGIRVIHASDADFEGVTRGLWNGPHKISHAAPTQNILGSPFVRNPGFVTQIRKEVAKHPEMPALRRRANTLLRPATFSRVLKGKLPSPRF